MLRRMSISRSADGSLSYLRSYLDRTYALAPFTRRYLAVARNRIAGAMWRGDDSLHLDEHRCGAGNHFIHRQRPFAGCGFPQQRRIAGQTSLIEDIDFREGCVRQFLVLHEQGWRGFEQSHVKLVVVPFAIEHGDQLLETA